ncbi:MAG: ribosome silencing factor [Halanaerobiales bacterium]
MAKEQRIKEIALIAAEAADDKKAKDIQVLEVSELTVIADYFVICSGNSENQVQAIAREIEDVLSEEGVEPQKVAGASEGRWILLDYADVIVHVFHQQERDYYEIERLWADAEKILRQQSHEAQ